RRPGARRAALEPRCRSTWKILQVILHPQARAVDAGHDGADRTAQLLRDLLVAEPSEDAQHESGAERLVERVHQPLHGVRGIGLAHADLGVASVRTRERLDGVGRENSGALTLAL